MDTLLMCPTDFNLSLGRFDIWGETVELANSMRDTAVNNSIVVNEPAYWRLRDQFVVQSRMNPMRLTCC
jgi:class 3 adenylate cyclase